MKNSFFFFSLLILMLSGCKSKNDILYLQNPQEISSEVNFVMPKLQVNDILNIRVMADNLQAADVFNSMPVSIQGGQMMTHEILKMTGNLVNEKGEINFPVLGTIKVTDYTIVELEEYLSTQLESRDLLINPKVLVRVINAKVSILGEVARPGLYTFTEQVITLPQALGMAGDLTINAERNNITIVREENGKRTTGYVDLTQANLFESPYYYVKQKDMIYVQPNGPKVKSAGYVGNVGTILGLGSFLLTLTLILTR